MGTDSLATRSEFVGELRQTLFQSFDAVGEEAYHLVEVVDRPILKRNSALEFHDLLVHRQILLARCQSPHSTSCPLARSKESLETLRKVLTDAVEGVKIQIQPD